MAMIHRIGMPENKSETKAIKRLGKNLPDDYFVFHNFELTTGRGLPANPSDVVPASDVNSLGLVFYQLITGQPPKHDVEAVLAGKGPAIDTKLLEEELRRSGAQGDWAGAAEIITRMCAPERADRYATVADVMEDLAICDL